MYWQHITAQTRNNTHGDLIILSDIEHATFGAGLGPNQQHYIMTTLEQTPTGKQNILLSTSDDQAGNELDYFHARYFTTETSPEEVRSAKHFHRTLHSQSDTN
jgi:hypothetical protein